MGADYYDKIVALEADGSIRSQLILWETDTPGQIRARAEADGTLRAFMIGWTGAAQAPLLLETSGELKTVLHGKDGASNIDPLLTNANMELVVEQRAPAYAQPYLRIASPNLLTTSEAELVDLSLAAADRVLVYFTVVNYTATVQTATLGIDTGNDTLAGSEYIMNTEPIPANGSSGFRGPFSMFGTNTLRGLASANTSLSVHWVFYVHQDRVGV
jgi:hypothetical protein